MTSDLDRISKTVLSASRRGFLRSRKVFKPYASTSPDELAKLEREIGTPLPNDLRLWLLAVGYGDINDELSFRPDWLARIESGALSGGALFAQDILGNFYAFDSGGHIFYMSRSDPVFADLAGNFLAFIEELVRRDFKLLAWVNTLQTRRYEW